MTDDGRDKRESEEDSQKTFSGFSAERDAPVEDDGGPRARHRFVLLTAGILLTAVIVFVITRGSSPIEQHPASELLAAGKEAMDGEQFDVALDYFHQAEEQGGELPIEILFNCADASLQLGRATDAEQHLRSLLQREPEHVGANELLCGILRTAGRNWELRPHAMALMQQDVCTPGNLVAIASADSARERGDQSDRELESFIGERAAERDELITRLGQARFFLQHNHDETAWPILQSIVEQDPSQLEAQARLGGLLLQHATPQDIQQWQERLPTDGRHPELWIVFGRWSEQQKQPRAAARCYWEALRQNPDHQGAVNRLARLLLQLDRRSDAEAYVARAKQLANVQQLVSQWGADPSNLKTLAELMENLGRPWEAFGWCTVAMNRQTGGDTSWAVQQAERLRSEIKPDTPLVVDESNLALRIDLSDWPLPDWSLAASSANVAEQVEGGSSDIKFIDSASEAGVTFSFFNGADPRRALMFEFSGGGVAVLDYDADGWPDLYLTQGCPWPPQSEQVQHTDRLFRNLGDGRFEDVTERAGLKSNRYGQGVAVGDIDNDGFADLYVANIGTNQLYHNNGDGTFRDITEESGISSSVWTASVMIADLNRDSWPELYDVNYLGGPDVFDEICLREGKPIQCAPTKFPAEQDCVYRNTGDGFFQDVTQRAGIKLPGGKGMGIVAADFDGSRRLSLFVANDTTTNFFFVNQTPSPGDELQFSERALVSGLALSESGKAASCMGIAIGDVNADERLDLFVTNFQDEPNNLFVQGSELLFDDRVRQTRLHDPGFLMEGWGAQFLDADLDGKPDLVVANGHLDDYPHSMGVNRMPTQFFQHAGERFTERPADQLGPYFETTKLGRAIARLDWDRDGRPDFCVTHTDAPFALLTNQTGNVGHHLVVHLRGVESSRDAIGTRVTVRSGDQIWSKQLVAGDGFSASNQRQLIFGLGNATEIDEVTIRWPSGSDQTFSQVAIDAESIFIEGHDAPLAVDAR